MLKELFLEKLGASPALQGYDIDFVSDERNVVTLKGEVDVWQHVVDIGHIAGKLPDVKGVVNLLTSKDDDRLVKDKTEAIRIAREKGVIDACDILIVGAGITGAGIARTLSKYNRKIIVAEKALDVSEGTSKSNNGMIHSGYDSKNGSLKAILNVKGNAMYAQWAEELNFKFNRTGSFVIGFDESDHDYLSSYYELGKKNGVPGIALITGDEARAIEPTLQKEVTEALWTPSAGYVETYNVVEALMENAIDNGTKLMLDTEVLAMDLSEGKVTDVITNQGIIKTGCVINAAGLYADEVAEMAGDRFYTIHNRRGTLVILDKKKKPYSNQAFVGTPPKNFTKGGGPQTTPEGNPLWGPSAKEVPDKEDTGVDPLDLQFVMDKGKRIVSNITEKDIITFFGGARPANYVEDFIIEASEKVANFIHVAAIQSPGVASAPAIAEMVEGIYLKLFPDTEKDPEYNPIRKPVKPFRDCTTEEREALIAQDARYGHIICRCETVTEGDIAAAIHGKIPAMTVDAVKRRTRSGMGRCQGGFCGPRVVELLAKELGIDPCEVKKSGKGSNMLCQPSREEEQA